MEVAVYCISYNSYKNLIRRKLQVSLESSSHQSELIETYFLPGENLDFFTRSDENCVFSAEKSCFCKLRKLLIC
jgi:hypothetical protein